MKKNKIEDMYIDSKKSLKVFLPDDEIRKNIEKLVKERKIKFPYLLSNKKKNEYKITQLMDVKTLKKIMGMQEN